VAPADLCIACSEDSCDPVQEALTDAHGVLAHTSSASRVMKNCCFLGTIVEHWSAFAS
jgi:hypothetical protein